MNFFLVSFFVCLPGISALVVTSPAPRLHRNVRVSSAAMMTDEGPAVIPSLVVNHPKIPAVALVSGDIMPALAFGTWKVDKDTTADIVYQAIEHGYRHIDTAPDYGNEKEVGEGIRRALNSGLIESREHLWVSSKLWSTHHKKEHVQEALLQTLSDLGLDYLDLYQIQFPIAIAHIPISERYPPSWVFDPDAKEPTIHFEKVPLQETWGALEELVDEGRIRNIGLCNVNVALLWDLISYARIPPTVVQIERHILNQRNKFVEFCHSLNIAVTAYSPLGAEGYIPDNLAKNQDSTLSSPTVLNIAQEHGKSCAQIMLRWNIQTGATLVCKTSTPTRLEKNMDILGFELSQNNLERLSKLDKGIKFNDPAVFMKRMNAFLPIFD